MQNKLIVLATPCKSQWDGLVWQMVKKTVAGLIWFVIKDGFIWFVKKDWKPLLFGLLKKDWGRCTELLTVFKYYRRSVHWYLMIQNDYAHWRFRLLWCFFSPRETSLLIFFWRSFDWEIRLSDSQESNVLSQVIQKSKKNTRHKQIQTHKL